MKLKTLATAACISLGAASNAAAATFTVGSSEYEVTTIFGTFTDLQSVLNDQPWWGDMSLAYEFAEAVADEFGGVNSGIFGPLFAFDQFDSFTNLVAYIPSSSTVAEGNTDANVPFTYATAVQVAAVPLPAGGLLLLSGLGGVAALKRRKKRAA